MLPLVDTPFTSAMRHTFRLLYISDKRDIKLIVP
jgi:hypothetical protein